VSEEWSISDICYDCGYQNMSYFNRQFKNIIGQTPQAYRKMLLYPDDNLITLTEEEFG
jgi:AraC-like DNA-binding protein